MNEKVKQHLIAIAQKNDWDDTDDDTLLEILTEAEEVYSKKISDSRWWYTEFIVADVDGMLIGYEYAKANRDENVRELGWEFDYDTICEVEAVQETVTVYRKVNPAQGNGPLNTMIQDPNVKTDGEVKGDEAADLKAAPDTANEQATEEGEKAAEE
jgi:hypothetical protein